jgi:hypothetical protein
MPTVEEIFEEHAVDGKIPDDVMSGLLADMEGDTEIETEDETETVEQKAETDETDGPELEAESEEVEETEPEEEPVIMAKDGKNVIEDGFQKLRDARDDRNAAKAEVDRLTEENNRLAEQLKGTTEEEEVPEEAKVELGELFTEDYPDDASKIASQIKTLIEHNKELEGRVKQLDGALSKTVNETAADRHFREIKEAHSDYVTVVDSPEFKAWIEKQPTIVWNAYNGVLEKGKSSEVNELLTTFKEATTGETVVKPTKEELAKKADELEKKVVKKTAPNSLSDVPGETVIHDEKDRLLNMSTAQLDARWAGKTPEEIESDIARYV